MTDTFIKESKNFRTQMKWCSIMLWLSTLIFLWFKPEVIAEIIMIPIGTVILTIIYFKINSQIKEYEHSRSNRE